MGSFSFADVWQSSTTMKFLVLIFSTLVAATYAAPTHPVEKLAPRPFAYQYGVKDGDSGPSFDSSESQNAEGVVEGEYSVALPDGRTQIVSYKADHVNGFVADVKYENTAV